MNTYDIEVTDTFGGEANYSWVRRYRVDMPELTHYGYDGSQGYAKANRSFERELMRKAKAQAGWTGRKGRRENLGETIAFYPYGSAVVMFVTYREEA